MWAVGWFKRDGYFQPLTYHWDGTAWSAIALPTTGAKTSSLAGVVALGPSVAYAVGWSAPLFDGVVFRWNGTAWHAVKAIDGSVGTWDGIDATSPSDVWIVGRGYAGGAINPIAEHFDRTRWVESFPPGAGAKRDGLTAVDDIGADDVWAVGMPNGSVTNRPLADHLDRTGWARATTPWLGDASLVAVDHSSSADVWAVGSKGYYHPAVIRLSSGSWKTVDTSSFPDSVVGGLAVRSTTDVWVTGGATAAVGPWIERWNGSSWSAVSPGELPSTTSGVGPIRQVGSQLWMAFGWTRPSGNVKHSIARVCPFA